MKYFLFSDNEVWHREIKANTFKGALLKAKKAFGIAVPLRCVAYHGESRDYKSTVTRYECNLREV